MTLMPRLILRLSRLVTFSVMLTAAVVGPSHADEVELRIPIISEQRHLYYMGLLEAETEMGENGAGIVIDPTLVLKYDLDMRFCLSRHSAVLQPVLVSALATAERSGLIKKFSQNYYKSITRSLRLKERRVITLPLPPTAP